MSCCPIDCSSFDVDAGKPDVAVSGTRLAECLTSLENDRSFVTLGGVRVEAAPAQLSTVLGSCVSIFLWSAERRIGGLNHFLLPWSTPEDRSTHRGDVASARLLDRMLVAGAPRNSLVAKIFGGASSAPTVWRMGAENILCAWEMLAQARIRVAAADVGGRRGRHVTFDVSTGRAVVHYLASP